MKAWIHKKYHLVIAGVLFLSVGIYCGTNNVLTALFLKPVSETLQVSRASMAFAGGMGTVAVVLSTMLSSSVLRKLHYRKAAVLGFLVAGGAMFLHSYIRGLWMYAAVSVLYSMCSGICSTAGTTYEVRCWFHKHVGLTLGLVLMSTGISGSLVNIGITSVIQRLGWRVGYRVLAVMMFSVAGLIAIFIRNFPEDMGLRPYGEGAGKGRVEKKKLPIVWAGYSARECRKLPAFWLFLFLVILSCFSVYLTFFFMSVHLQGQGFSMVQAASIHSIMLLAMAGAKLLCGEACDLIGVKRVVVVCMMIGAFSQWALMDVHSYGVAAFWAVIFSCAMPVASITVPLLADLLFGYRNQEVNSGVAIAMISVGSLIAQPVANAIYDSFGSYRIAFGIGAVLDLVSVILFLVLYSLAEKDKKRKTGNLSSG